MELNQHLSMLTPKICTEDFSKAKPPFENEKQAQTLIRARSKRKI